MYTKILFVLGLAALANSQYYGGHPQEIYGPPEPYQFSYGAATHDGGGLSQQEVGDETGAKRGSYSLTHEGGTRTVEYVADAGGFRAIVNTNEPGTAQSQTAGAAYNSPYPGYGGHGRGY